MQRLSHVLTSSAKSQGMSLGTLLGGVIAPSIGIVGVGAAGFRLKRWEQTERDWDTSEVLLSNQLSSSSSSSRAFPALPSLPSSSSDDNDDGDEMIDASDRSSSENVENGMSIGDKLRSRYEASKKLFQRKPPYRPPASPAHISATPEDRSPNAVSHLWLHSLNPSEKDLDGYVNAHGWGGMPSETTENVFHAIRLEFRKAVRALRTVSVSAMIIADYKWTLANSPTNLSSAPPNPAEIPDDNPDRARRLRRLRRAIKVARDEEHEVEGGSDVLKELLKKEEGLVDEHRQELLMKEAAEFDMTPDEVEMRRTAKAALHVRNAQRLLWLCRANAGMFIKAGQHISSLNHAIPQAFVQTMSVLMDAAPYREYKDVEALFRRETGGLLPTDVFAKFSRDPIASASLAQVHHAWTWDGQEVAVKVQYPDLLESFKGDLSTLRMLARVIRWVFPDSVDLTWMLDEFQAGLYAELDFLNEGRNADKLRRLAASPAGQLRASSSVSVHIPEVKWEYTTQRILTMEFVHGVRINEVDKLNEAGWSLHALSTALMNTFGTQIYVHGFVHADPHPGNILVRPTPGKPHKPQLVLLDHGLYVNVQEGTRVPYCRLWSSLLSGNRAGAAAAARDLGAGEWWDLLAWLLTHRPVGGPTPTAAASQPTREDARKVAKRMQKFGNQSISDFIQELPREWFFIQKTNNLLRAIVRDLGGSVNRLLIMGSAAVTGAHVTPSGEFAPGFYNRAAYYADTVAFWSRVGFGLAMWQIILRLPSFKSKPKEEEEEAEVEEEVIEELLEEADEDKDDRASVGGGGEQHVDGEE